MTIIVYCVQMVYVLNVSLVWTDYKTHLSVLVSKDIIVKKKQPQIVIVKLKYKVFI